MRDASKGLRFNILVPIETNAPSLDSVTVTLIEEFEPDYIVVKDESMVQVVAADGRDRVLTMGRTFSAKFGWNPTFGISTNAVLSFMYDKSWKYVHRHERQPHLIIPKIPEEGMDLFCDAVFGSFPTCRLAERSIPTMLKETFGAKEIVVGESNYWDVVGGTATPKSVLPYPTQFPRNALTIAFLQTGESFCAPEEKERLVAAVDWLKNSNRTPGFSQLDERINKMRNMLQKDSG